MEKILEIIEVLEEQNKLYKKALGLSQKRNDALAAEKAGELQLILKEEEVISEIIKNKEKERLSLMEDPDKKLLEIIDETSDKTLKENLINQREELKETLIKIKENNDMSQKLIKISNGVLNRLIEKLTGQKEIGYNRDKTKQSLSKKTLLNKKG